MTWIIRHRVLDRALYVASGLAWIGLGIVSYTSNRTIPGGGSGVWLFLAATASGSCMAVAHYQSKAALSMYYLAAFVNAVARSAAYIQVGAWSPMFVWLIVLIASIRSYLYMRG